MIISKQKLLELLNDITESIKANDSFEGRLSYTCLNDACKKEEFEVDAFIRVGNSEGQGGCILIQPLE